VTALPSGRARKVTERSQVTARATKKPTTVITSRRSSATACSGDRAPLATKVPTAANTNTRSAIGSISAPQRLVAPSRRASHPSSMSVNEATPTSARRSAAPLDATKPAASTTRDSDTAFGMVQSVERGIPGACGMRAR
jgi:hypothetical protein